MGKQRLTDEERLERKRARWRKSSSDHYKRYTLEERERWNKWYEKNKDSYLAKRRMRRQQAKLGPKRSEDCGDAAM